MTAKPDRSPRVFISYATEDREVADQVCASLEANGVECWIAPRDIPIGCKWPKAVVEAIDGLCGAMVLVLSRRANRSGQVRREVTEAASRDIPIVTLRIEDILPSKDLKLFVQEGQWLDALTPPLANHLALLAAAVKTLPALAARPAEKPAPMGRRRAGAVKVNHAAVLRRDMSRFVRGAKQKVQDKAIRERLICAREAIQEVAAFFDCRWQRGRHTLSAKDVAPIRVVPEDRISIPLALHVLDVLVARLNQPPAGKCNINADEGGLIQSVPGATETWILDSIDGSRHLMKDLPLFASSIALVDKSTRPVLAMVFVPVTGELFFAVRGCGAYLNHWDNPLRVSRRTVAEAVVNAEFPNVDELKDSAADFRKGCQSLRRILAEVKRVRGLGIGSLGLAYLAKGAFDGFVSLPGTALKHDMLAGALLVREANGRAEIRPAPRRRQRGFGMKSERDRVRVVAGNRLVFPVLRNIVF